MTGERVSALEEISAELSKHALTGEDRLEGVSSSEEISAELSRPMKALSGISTDISADGLNVSDGWTEKGDKGIGGVSKQ